MLPQVCISGWRRLETRGRRELKRQQDVILANRRATVDDASTFCLQSHDKRDQCQENDAHKCNCVAICQRLLDGYNDEEHRRPRSGTLSQNPKGTTEWKNRWQETRCQPVFGNVDLEEGSTVTRGGCSAMLAGKLKAKISKKYWKYCSTISRLLLARVDVSFSGTGRVKQLITAFD